MQATLSDSYYEDSASTTFEDARYDPNDMLAFVASIEHENNSYCDSDSDINDGEFTDEQRAKFFDNIFIEHERLIKSYTTNHEILNANKNKIDVLNAENSNLLEKIRFLKSKHHSLLEKNNVPTQQIKNNKPSSFMNENFHLGTKVLNEILDKGKTYGKQRRLGYISKEETPSSRETMFVKDKDDTPNQVESPKNTSLYTHYKKIGHSQSRCYSRFLKRFETQMNRLMSDFNSLKNNILNNGKGK